MADKTIQMIVTTPDFRRGQAAAREVGAKQSQPNWPLIEREHPEFLIGFRYEWNEYVVHTLKTPAEQAEALAQELAEARKALADLAPYNGTVPGARAVAKARVRVETLEALVAL